MGNIKGYIRLRNNGIVRRVIYMVLDKKRIAVLNMERYVHLKKIISEVAVPYVIIKGEPLSLLCYNKNGARNSQDIDILIERQHLAYLERILIENGFVMHTKSNKAEKRGNRILCISQSHQIPPYIKETQNQQIEIDLNFDIFWGEYPGKRIDIGKFLSDAVEMEIHGCKIKALPPLKAIVQLALIIIRR